jgi:predicted transcriptional regulator
MTEAVVLSIKPVFARQILEGRKTIELRRSALGLHAQDVVIVYVSAPEQALGFWFRVAKVETTAVEEMWQRNHAVLGIARKDYLEYFAGSALACGFHVGELHKLEPPVSLSEIRLLVPGFVPPQSMLILRDAWGQYSTLLSRICPPLPRDVLPQQSLFDAVEIRDAGPAEPWRSACIDAVRATTIETAVGPKEEDPRARSGSGAGPREADPHQGRPARTSGPSSSIVPKRRRPVHRAGGQRTKP